MLRFLLRAILRTFMRSKITLKSHVEVLRRLESVFITSYSFIGGLWAGHSPVCRSSCDASADSLGNAVLETMRFSRTRDRRPFKNREGWVELEEEMKSEYNVDNLGAFLGDLSSVSVTRVEGGSCYEVTGSVPSKTGHRGSMAEIWKETLDCPSPEELGVAVLRALDELDKARER